MTRVQIQQTLAIFLLLSFGGIWWVTQGVSPRSSPPVSVEEPVSLPAVEEPHPVVTEEGGLENDPTVKKNPFEIPGLLEERFRQLELRKKEGTASATAPGEEMKPPPVEIQPPSFQVQAILWGTGRPQAIINRRIVSVGDTVEGVKVLRISREGVSVSFGSKEFVYRLPEEQRAKNTQKEWVGR